MLINLIYKVSGFMTVLGLLLLCGPKADRSLAASHQLNYNNTLQDTLPITIEVTHDITVENYFQYLDSLVNTYNAITPYKFTEHLLVRANPWIIDSLQNTDYYHKKALDSFVFNQKKMIVLTKGATLTIPDAKAAQLLLDAFKNTRIDVNIPEFKLRIYEDSIKRYEFTVRVGKNETKFLKMSGRTEDLKTKTGKGRIVNYVRDPRYVNPVNNRQYFVTRRDDEKITQLPQIPFIETEINGLRNGQLIHPTTNPVTLGKAYSNGCIGTNEADAWVIYYYAPIDTPINIRYDLEVVNAVGDSIVLKDIYGKNKQKL